MAIQNARLVSEIQAQSRQVDIASGVVSKLTGSFVCAASIAGVSSSSPTWKTDLGASGGPDRTAAPPS